MEPEGKFCNICGENCAGLPRIKDVKGRYYHKECYEDAMRERDERRAAAARASIAPPPAPPGEPDTASLLGEMIDSEAPPLPPGGTACPSCGHVLAPDAVICVSCGFNVQSGHTMEVKVAKAKHARRGKSAAGDAASFNLFQPFTVSMAILAILMGLFFLVRTSDDLAVTGAFLLFASAFMFGTGIFVLVLAFQESMGQGLLTLCVPFYVLYFVFGVTENQWARWLFLVSLITRVACLTIDVPEAPEEYSGW